MALAGIAAGSFVLALPGALVPGPMFSVTLAGSHRHGFWFGPGVVLGHALAEAPVVAALLLGLSQFLKEPWLLVAIGTVGGGTMILMGVALARRVGRPPPLSSGSPDGPQARGAGLVRFGPIPAGFLTSILNPYWYLWWVTQPAYLLAAAWQMGWAGVAAFFVGHISVDLLWYSATSLGVSRGRRLLMGKGYQALLVVCAIILFVMAALFLVLAGQQVLAVRAAGD